MGFCIVIKQDSFSFLSPLFVFMSFIKSLASIISKVAPFYSATGSFNKHKTFYSIIDIAATRETLLPFYPQASILSYPIDDQLQFVFILKCHAVSSIERTLELLYLFVILRYNLIHFSLKSILYYSVLVLRTGRFFFLLSLKCLLIRFLTFVNPIFM